MNANGPPGPVVGRRAGRALLTTLSVSVYLDLRLLSAYRLSDTNTRPLSSGVNSRREADHMSLALLGNPGVLLRLGESEVLSGGLAAGHLLQTGPYAKRGNCDSQSLVPFLRQETLFEGDRALTDGKSTGVAQDGHRLYTVRGVMPLGYNEDSVTAADCAQNLRSGRSRVPEPQATLRQSPMTAMMSSLLVRACCSCFRLPRARCSGPSVGIRYRLGSEAAPQPSSEIGAAARLIISAIVRSKPRAIRGFSRRDPTTLHS